MKGSEAPPEGSGQGRRGALALEGRPVHKGTGCWEVWVTG